MKRVILRHKGASFSSSASSFVVDNPYTGEEACRIKFHSLKEVEETLLKANKAQKQWSHEASLLEKIDVVNKAYTYLKKHSDTLASDITNMMGKPLKQSIGEINTSADRAATMNELAIEVLAEEHHRDTSKKGLELTTRRVPVGIVVVIGKLSTPCTSYSPINLVCCYSTMELPHRNCH